jgi:O-antigen/teichoic acid export membrane protein
VRGIDRTKSDIEATVSRRPSLKINAISNWTSLAVSVGTSFFLIPAILAHLGEKRFGMWMLVSSLVGYLGLLRLGIGTGVLRYVPLFHGKGAKAKVDTVVSTGMAFYTGVGVLILVLSWFSADFIAGFFQGGGQLAVLIRLTGLAAALECPSLIFDVAVKGYEGFVYTNLITIFGTIIRAGALFACIFLDYGLVAMGGVLVMDAFVMLLARGITFRKYCKGIKVGTRETSLAVLKLLVLYGLIIMVESGGTLLTYESPKQIVGKVVSLEALGLFSIAAVLVRYYFRFILASTQVFMPRFSYLFGQNDDEEIRRLFFRGTKYVTIIAGAGALLLWSVGASFLKLWVKTDGIVQIFPALKVLAAGMLVFASHRMSVDLLFGLGKQKIIAMFAMCEGICVFGLALVLSYRYGMTGVAVGISAPFVLIRGVVQANYVCRLTEIGFWKYYTHCIVKPWCIAGALAVAIWWLGVVNCASSWLYFFLISLLIMFVYFAIVYFTAVETQEKAQIRVQIVSCFNKLAGARN